MKFKKISWANGTGLAGYCEAKYAEIEEVLGEPSFGPDDPSGDGKVTCQWILQFEDGTIATLYDYKHGCTPFGLYRWHIGGISRAAVDRMQELFPQVVIR